MSVSKPVPSTCSHRKDIQSTVHWKRPPRLCRFLQRYHSSWSVSFIKTRFQVPLAGLSSQIAWEPHSDVGSYLSSWDQLFTQQQKTSIWFPLSSQKCPLQQWDLGRKLISLTPFHQPAPEGLWAVGHFKHFPPSLQPMSPSYPISAAGLGSQHRAPWAPPGNDRQMGLLTSHRAPQPDSAGGAVSEGPSTALISLREEQTDCLTSWKLGKPFPHITLLTWKKPYLRCWAPLSAWEWPPHGNKPRSLLSQRACS